MTNWTSTDVEKEGVWFYADECGNVEAVGELVQEFLKKFRPNDCFSLTYATYCSKLRLGEFGGGAIFVTADEVKWENAYTWVQSQEKEFHEQSRGP